jgi:peptide/nickel transport system substrate-binding protein
MPSTRRTDDAPPGGALAQRGRSHRLRRALGAALALVASVGLVAYAAANFPKPPQGPRYRGEGDEAPRSGGTFVFSAASNVRTLDPFIAYDELSYTAIRLLFDGLLDYDYDGQLVPSLAVAMPEISPDGKVFTFHLREGVRFHNGRELTAADVNWSMHKMLAEGTSSPGYPFFKSLEGVEAYHAGRAPRVAGIERVDRYTIAFHLTEPDRTFLNALAMPFAYPVPRENYERWAKQSESAVGMHPVGTGPFVLREWERGVQLVFERNRAYWRRGEAHPDRMIYLENLSDEVPVARFRNGDLDILTGAPSVHYLFFKQSEAWEPFLDEAPGPTIVGLALNCEMPPFDNVHVRRAVAFALDRDAMKQMLQGRAMPAGQALPSLSPGFDPALPSLQRLDLERAREEMRLAGYPDGLPEPVTIMIGEGPGSLRLAQLWQQDLARIGIEVQLRQVSFATYLEQTGKPRTVQAFTSAWHMDFPDPSNILDVLFNSRAIRPENSENRSFYRNPELDALLDRARVEVDPDARLALYRRANEIVTRDAPWAFLYTPLEMEVWQPYVKGYRPHPIWTNEYRQVWLDLPRHRVDPDTYWRPRTTGEGARR